MKTVYGNLYESCHITGTITEIIDNDQFYHIIIKNNLKNKISCVDDRKLFFLGEDSKLQLLNFKKQIFLLLKMNKIQLFSSNALR